MSKIVTNNITPRSGGNIDVTGKLSVSGDVTGAAATFTGNVTGAAATFTGNVSVGGTLTYEDVTNIDSVGLITARSGIKVNAGGINVAGGGANIVGVVTVTTIQATTYVGVPEGTNVLKAMLFS
jgi:hypothetical protein